ncbi:MAG TPA: hypothetical protein PLD25_15640 [Chloroflexota bacterium]|nr:hypothetical protein [Chloroflexota bacterium]
MDRLSFHEAHKLICWFPTGELTSEIIVNYYLAMKACVWGQEANRFCDFGGVDNFVLDYNKMQGLVRYRQTTLRNHKDIQLGIYCPNDVGYALSRMYQMLIDGFGIETFIARELGPVAQFLSVPVGLLRFGDADL